MQGRHDYLLERGTGNLLAVLHSILLRQSLLIALDYLEQKNNFFKKLLFSVRFPVKARDFSVLHKRSDRLCGLPSLLYNGYRGLGLFPRG
jgi:hypothetical protein